MNPLLTQRLFRLLFWVALVFALIMALTPAPALLEGADDKALHALAFAALAVLIAPAFPKAPLILLFWVLALIGGVIEGIQAIPVVGRVPSLDDWLADIVASGTALAIVGLFRALRQEI